MLGGEVEAGLGRAEVEKDLDTEVLAEKMEGMEADRLEEAIEGEDPGLAGQGRMLKEDAGELGQERRAGGRWEGGRAMKSLGKNRD